MKIIAHRGASSYAPENTLIAFEKAIEKRSDGIELDVRLSKDGIPVICHDATINRTSNGKGYIHNLTVDQLKQYDFGSFYDKKYKRETIPTFEEALQLIGQHEVMLHIELKNGPTIPPNLEQKVLELVYTYNFQHRVVYSSFDHLSLKRLAILDPQAKIGLIFHMNLIHLFDYIRNTGINVHSIHPNYFYVTEEMIRDAKALCLDVNIYTVNNRKMALHYQKLGVDGLITNDPLLLQ